MFFDCSAFFIGHNICKNIFVYDYQMPSDNSDNVEMKDEQQSQYPWRDNIPHNI